MSKAILIDQATVGLASVSPNVQKLLIDISFIATHSLGSRMHEFLILKGVVTPDRLVDIGMFSNSCSNNNNNSSSNNNNSSSKANDTGPRSINNSQTKKIPAILRIF